MDAPTLFAKLAGLKIQFARLLNQKAASGGLERYYSPKEVHSHLVVLERVQASARQTLPDFFADMPPFQAPSGQVSITREAVLEAYSVVDYMLQVRVYSIPQGGSEKEPMTSEKTKAGGIFISHGRASEWYKVRDFLRADLKSVTIELEHEPNLGRTVIQKLEQESAKCSVAVIVLTGDDLGADGKPKPRGNVLHEIGYFQGRFGTDRVCILFEEGTDVPSNIHGIVYIPFPKNFVEATFHKLKQEIDAMSPKG